MQTLPVKIAVITSTRAEYGLLRPLIRALSEDESFAVQVLVTGTHLLEKYGHTVDYIKEDQVEIAYQCSHRKSGDCFRHSI